jgi:hypothetical protein
MNDRPRKIDSVQNGSFLPGFGPLVDPLPLRVKTLGQPIIVEDKSGSARGRATIALEN